MEKIFKTFSLVTFVVIFLFILASNVNAQGTNQYSCIWSTSQNRCVVGVNNCPDGQNCSYNCAGRTVSNCQGVVFNCSCSTDIPENTFSCSFDSSNGSCNLVVDNCTTGTANCAQWNGQAITCNSYSYPNYAVCESTSSLPPNTYTCTPIGTSCGTDENNCDLGCIPNCGRFSGNIPLCAQTQDTPPTCECSGTTLPDNSFTCTWISSTGECRTDAYRTCDPGCTADCSEFNNSSAQLCEIPEVRTCDCSSLTPPPITITPRPPILPTCNTSYGIEGINTAIGCIPTNNENLLASFILRWALGIGGGISFVLMAVAGTIITLSGGDPGKLQNGKELLTAAIAGIVLILFSAFILELVGVSILRLPGF